MRKRTSYLLLGVLVLLVVLFAWSGVAWATTFSNPVDANNSHIDNSVYLSQADFPGGAAAAVLAGSENYTDALTATVLAKAAGGPLLLTSSTSLSTQVQSELVRLKLTKVYIVGLPTTVVSAVRAALPSLTSTQIVVLTGTDRYQTAALVASQSKQLAGKAPARVFIVPGDVYGASLAAAAVAAANGWPILLTPQAGPFPSASAQEITALGVTAGVEVDTSVSPGVSGFNIEKTIVGSGSTSYDPGNRYTESLAMAEYAVQQGWATYAHLAIGEEEGGSVPYTNNFPDNVLLASHIAGEDGAYLLTRSTGLYSTVADLLTAQGKEVASVEFMRPDYANVSSTTWSFAAIRQVKSLNSARVTRLSATSGPLAGGGTLKVTGRGFTGATRVVMGKTDLPAGSWKVNSDTSITIDSVPAATQPGAMEVLVYNYWNVDPSNPSDVYFYTSSSSSNLAAMQVVQQAVKYLGVPYVWAGASPNGFDCSGLTSYVYNQFTWLTGVTLPHHAAYQATYGTAVNQADLLPGDLVFFESPIGHVGIYVGNGLMINAPRSGDLVTIENVFRSDYATARRIISPYTRYEQTDSRLIYGGTWYTWPSSALSGGSYKYSSSTGAYVVIPFSGTRLGLIGTKGPNMGIASISVDGEAAVTCDLYTATAANKQVIFTTGALTSGQHWVKLSCAGTKSPSSTGYFVNLDAVDVAGSLVSPQRFEQTDSHIVYSTGWASLSTAGASGSSYKYTNTSEASATLTFNGTSISVIATKAKNFGRMKITLDSGAPVYIDLYSASTLYKQTVYSSGFLTPGTHTLKIERSGLKNTSSYGYTISLDALDVRGSSK